MRVALFGGTFDPPHLGHVAIAKAAAEAFALDLVLFAPAGIQPLKGEAHTPYLDRLQMVQLACTGDELGAPLIAPLSLAMSGSGAAPAPTRFLPSTIDAPAPNGQPNYTVDTLRKLVAAYPGTTLYNLVGADSFHTLGKWRGTAELLQLAEWIVVSRPGYPLADPESYPLSPSERRRVHLLDAVHLDISATALRDRLAAGDPCDDLLPPAVADYIRTHQLYRQP